VTDYASVTWNVLNGEMSLVGPRPELPEIVATYAPWQRARRLVTPGITGWRQVNRDAHRLMHEATELDLEYIRRQSLWLDLWILVRTAGQ
jgi:lipopolysaccharide/colanic/teichoic acid biosynthesis glycosyltransferase